MQRIVLWRHRWVPGLLVLALAGAAWAEKPEWAGNGRARGSEARGDDRRDDRREDRRDDRYGDRRDDRRDDRREPHAQAPRTGSVAIDIRIGGYFGEPQRVAAHDYYRQQYRSGSCPPGLAKKNNGCLPPGQARAWAMGQPLPAGVVVYPIDPAVQVRIGLPPAGYKYVRVASDILLIAIGSSMVIDAIQDLGR